MLGLQAVDTEAIGNCQFIAVVHSGGLNISHVDLRKQVVDALSRWPEYYSGFHLFNSFEN